MKTKLYEIFQKQNKSSKAQLMKGNIYSDLTEFIKTPLGDKQQKCPQRKLTLRIRNIVFLMIQ